MSEQPIKTPGMRALMAVGAAIFTVMTVRTLRDALHDSGALVWILAAVFCGISIYNWVWVFMPDNPQESA